MDILEKRRQQLAKLKVERLPALEVQLRIVQCGGVDRAHVQTIDPFDYENRVWRTVRNYDYAEYIKLASADHSEGFWVFDVRGPTWREPGQEP